MKTVYCFDDTPASINYVCLIDDQDHKNLEERLIQHTKKDEWNIHYTSRSCDVCGVHFDHDIAAYGPCSCVLCLTCFDSMAKNYFLLFAMRCPCGYLPNWSENQQWTLAMMFTEDFMDPTYEMFPSRDRVRCPVCSKQVIEEKVDQSASCKNQGHMPCTECSHKLCQLHVPPLKLCCLVCDDIEKAIIERKSFMDWWQSIVFHKRDTETVPCFLCNQMGGDLTSCCSMFHRCHSRCLMQMVSQFFPSAPGLVTSHRTMAASDPQACPLCLLIEVVNHHQLLKFILSGN